MFKQLTRAIYLEASFWGHRLVQAWHLDPHEKGGLRRAAFLSRQLEHEWNSNHYPDRNT